MPIDPASLAGQAAVYKVIGSGTGLKVVTQIMLTFMGVEQINNDAAYWYQLEITKAGGKQLIVSALLSDAYLTAERADRTTVHRYIFQDGDDQPLEYVNVVRGGAVTTPFGLLRNFFPTFSETDLGDEQFPRKGRFMGLDIERINMLKSRAVVPVDVLRLDLDPELLIGSSRNVRNTESGRIWTGDDYAYRKLEASDYDELIDAGFNYFRVTGSQERHIRNRPVFYLTLEQPRFLEYPEMFYRANFGGTTMFMDEPGVHIVWFIRLWIDYIRQLDHPAQVARLLEDRIKAEYDSSARFGLFYLDRLLRMVPYDLGDMRLSESNYPSWETPEWTAYYQMKAGMPGVVHEGRYVFGWEPQVLNAEFDARIPCKPESLFLKTYGLLRGSARVFDGDWGTAIYGQAEQEISPLAMTMAYDMGARYLWYWTSDRLHHVPYEEQLALTRMIRKHASHHPRPPLDELRAAAKVAIALPDGYTLHPFRLWDTEVFHLDRVNDMGVTYRQVLAAAVQQIERCVKEKIAFDLVYNDDAFAKRANNYDEVIFANEDGTLTGRRRDGSIFSVPRPTRSDKEVADDGPRLELQAENTKGPAPLAVKLTATAQSAKGLVGLKVRGKSGPGFTYHEIVWVIQVSPTEAGRLYGRSGEPIEIPFDKPGTYRIEAWTCDVDGIAARKEVTVEVQ